MFMSCDYIIKLVKGIILLNIDKYYERMLDVSDWWKKKLKAKNTPVYIMLGKNIEMHNVHIIY